MKRKILACVVACATLFLGMGYAYWTDSLQIDTTADTGELKVKFVDVALFGQYGNEELGWAIDNGDPDNPALADNFFNRGTAYDIPWEAVDMDQYLASIKNLTKTVFTVGLKPPVGDVPGGSDNTYDGADSSDGIAVTVNDIYPGYAQLFRTDIINCGTIAAKLTDLELSMAGENATMRNMIGVSLDVQRESGAMVKAIDSDVAGEFFYVGDQKFIRLSALDDSVIYDGTGDNLLYIYAAADNSGDNTMDAYFGIAMDPDYVGAYTTGHVGAPDSGDPAPVGNDANSTDRDASFSIKFLWDQFNTTAD